MFKNFWKLIILEFIILCLTIPPINAEVSFNINAPDSLKYNDKELAEFVIINNFNNEINGKILISVPYEIEVCGGDFDFSGGNTYVASFNLKPNEQKTLTLELKNKETNEKKAIIYVKTTYEVGNKSYEITSKKIIILKPDNDGAIPNFKGGFSERLLYYLTGCWYYLVATISSLIAMYMAYKEIREKNKKD